MVAHENHISVYEAGLDAFLTQLVSADTTRLSENILRKISALSPLLLRCTRSPRMSSGNSYHFNATWIIFEMEKYSITGRRRGETEYAEIMARVAQKRMLSCQVGIVLYDALARGQGRGYRNGFWKMAQNLTRKIFSRGLEGDSYRAQTQHYYFIACGSVDGCDTRENWGNEVIF